MLILTGQRRAEVSDLHRKELRGNTWHLPAARSKNRLAHEVPLSTAAMDLLAKMPEIGISGFVFTVDGRGPFDGFSYQKDKLDQAIEDLGGELEPWVLHDIRRSVATGMARIGVELTIIEKVLNHSSGSFKGVVGTYNRHGYDKQKREALEAWGKHVLSLVA
jgi:integrase